MTFLFRKTLLVDEDIVLIIDDFLANGQAVLGLLDIVEQANAKLQVLGLSLKKDSKHGGSMIREKGIRVESLAIIKSLANGKVEFVEESPSI